MVTFLVAAQFLLLSVSKANICVHPEATFEVLSIDHSSGKNGQYFNFDINIIDRILGRADWHGEDFVITNERTGETTTDIMWRSSNGGSHSGHGRQNDGSAKTGDFIMGDILCFTNIDKLYSAWSRNLMQQEIANLRAQVMGIAAVTNEINQKIDTATKNYK